MHWWYAMLFRPFKRDHAGEIETRIEGAAAVTPALMADIVAHCRRVDRSESSRMAWRLNAFVEAKAFTDAALALIEVELPHWSLVRIACEEGEWVCTLSRYARMPAWLGDTVDGRHALLPLAILSAVVAARAADLEMATAHTDVAPAPPRRRALLRQLHLSRKAQPRSCVRYRERWTDGTANGASSASSCP